ncbi:BEL1-like homeodomain protein 1 [Primulina huaijiensis]|uniref:BEL1-like homeodomain protein 1 n=1 Tax=Primulina huaijiensis TaxID=1492673 RepID=UPI003CC73810
MATYFHGNSEIQGNGDGLQTLILMNPTYVGFSENQQPQPPASNNFVFLNSSNNINLPHAPPPSQIQHFVGIPLQGASPTSAASPQDPLGQHDVSALHSFIPRNLYNQQIGIAAAREVTRSHQGLSLSLSSQQPANYSSFRLEREVPTQPIMDVTQPRQVDVRVSGGSPSSNSGVSNVVNGVQSVMFNSKYLNAAQEILDEVVKVQKGAKIVAELAEGAQTNGEPSGAGSGGGGGEEGKKVGVELTTSERQEIQMKKAKLVNMLDEVEQRYRQYHHQMQIVVSWFEQVTGIGSAKTYTALALQTISKQFRCLKDAILGQIRAATKSLGEEESLGGKTEGSKLKYVDNQIRQQRALQQLGMIQHNAWRPQRGLPERSVSVLRAWLFEHFLHPYPKDSDKLILAKQTGLTRSQVSNWFINARVRLWKPMVEEMYLEETKEQERNVTDDKSQDPEDSTPKNTAPQAKIPTFENQNSSRNESASVSTSTAFTSSSGVKNNSDFPLIGSSEMANFTKKSPKKLRIPSMNMDSKPTIPANEHMSLKFGNERQKRDEFTLIGSPTNFIGGFGSYPMGELGRFGDEQFQAPYSGNGVSLTLGLPHQNFMPNQSIQLERGGDSSGFGGMIM